MFRALLFVIFSMGIFFNVSSQAADSSPSIEDIMYGGFKTVDHFGIIAVSLQGSANDIGINEEDLTDYLKLRFKNSFASIGFDQIETEEFAEIYRDEEKAKKVGKIFVNVWTVGEDYPIAVHVSIDAGNLAAGTLYDNAVLGYGRKENVPASVRDAISEMVDALAVTFFKVRGEL